MAEQNPQWIDSHCHVYDEDELAGFARARDLDVIGCVVIGTDEESSRRAVRVANAPPPGGDQAWPRRFATIGLHPHDAVTGTAAISALVESAVVPRHGTRPPGSVVAVGECGLDYFYEHSPREEQRVAFASQIELAHRFDLTLVIHTRDAWDDTFAVLDEVGVPERTIVHCFSGGPTEATKCLDRGADLSFSGIVTFKSADDLRAAAVVCPLDRMLVETDSPYLAPVPHRGRPNEPGFVAIVGAYIAELRGIEPVELASRTRENTARAFAVAW